MPRNSSGVYTLPAGNPVVAFTTITTAWANPTMADIGNELTNSLDRNGRGGMLAPFRIFDGTISQPGLGFLNEVGIGLWRESSGIAHLVNAGTNVMTILPSRATFPHDVQVAQGVMHKVAGQYSWIVKNDAGTLKIMPSTAVDGETWDATKATSFSPTTGAPTFPTVSGAGYVKISGDTMTGNLAIGTNTLATTPSLTLNAAANQWKSLSFATAGVAEWTITKHWDNTNFEIAPGPTGTNPIVTMTQAGNFGIGVVPISKLHVEDATAAIVRVRQTGNTWGTALHDKGDMTTLSVVDNRPLTFNTSNAERMRIDPDGQVGIGANPKAVPGIGDVTTGYTRTQVNYGSINQLLLIADSITGAQRVGFGAAGVNTFDAGIAYGSGARDLKFYSSGAVAATLASTGALIFTTPISGSQVDNGWLVYRDTNEAGEQRRFEMGAYGAAQANGWYMRAFGAAGLTFLRNDSGLAAQINGNGNMSIGGSANDLFRLQVDGGNATNLACTGLVTKTFGSFGSNLYYDTSWKFAEQAGTYGFNFGARGGGGLKITVTSNASTGSGSAAALLDAMQINASGNAAIGSDVYGTVRLTINGPDSMKLRLSGGSTQNGITLAPVSGSSEYYIGAGINVVAGGDKGFTIYDVTGVKHRFNVSTLGLVNLQDLGGNTFALAIEEDGRIFTRAIHNNLGGAAGTTPMLASGTYTPVATPVTNIGAINGQYGNWQRVGNIVTVAGGFTASAVAAGNVNILLSLPIASNFTLVSDGGGTANAVGSPGGLAIADDSSKEMLISISNIADTALKAYRYTFTYLVKA